MNSTDSPLLLTTEEAAKLLAISPRKLWTMTKLGLVQCIRLGRSKRYAVEDLNKLINAHRSSAKRDSKACDDDSSDQE